MSTGNLIDGILLKKSILTAAGYADVYSVDAGSASLATIAAAGYLNAAVNTVTTGDRILINTDSADTAYSATVRNDGTNVYLDFDSTLWLQGFLDDVSTASISSICVPRGLIVQVGGCLDTQITVASATVNFLIFGAGAAITGSDLVFGTSDEAGVRVVADLSADNYVDAATSVSIISDGASTTASRGNFFIKMICAAAI